MGAALVTVVIPTYNEAQNLERAVSSVRAALPAADLLIVDDDSPDGTGELADRLALADSRVAVLHRSERRGLGPAYLAAFDHLLDAPAPPGVIVEMDADGSHPADRLPALVGALDDPAVGLSIGSRWVDGGRVVDWSRSRERISRVGNAYARRLLGLPVRDLTAGYRAFRREALVAAIAEPVASRGYCFQIDLARRVDDAGWSIVELPISFREREFGESKMDGRIVAEAMLRVTGWGLQRLVR